MKRLCLVLGVLALSLFFAGCFAVNDGPAGNQYVKCARDYQCAQSMTCSIEGICQHTAPLGCANDQECFHTQFCAKNGLCHEAIECGLDGDCEINEQCRAGLCHPAFVCTSDIDCPSDSYCDTEGYSKTLYGCGSQAECGDDFYCGIDGFCWPWPAVDAPEENPVVAPPTDLDANNIPTP